VTLDATARVSQVALHHRPLEAVRRFRQGSATALAESYTGRQVLELARGHLRPALAAGISNRTSLRSAQAACDEDCAAIRRSREGETQL
jgi:hypothetical protein